MTGPDAGGTLLCWAQVVQALTSSRISNTEGMFSRSLHSSETIRSLSAEPDVSSTWPAFHDSSVTFMLLIKLLPIFFFRLDQVRYRQMTAEFSCRGHSKLNSHLQRIAGCWICNADGTSFFSFRTTCWSSSEIFWSCQREGWTKITCQLWHMEIELTWHHRGSLQVISFSS